MSCYKTLTLHPTPYTLNQLLFRQHVRCYKQCNHDSSTLRHLTANIGGGDVAEATGPVEGRGCAKGVEAGPQKGIQVSVKGIQVTATNGSHAATVTASAAVVPSANVSQKVTAATGAETRAPT